MKGFSPFCDCDSGNDMPIIPDIGMFASFDPIALDEACADAVKLGLGTRKYKVNKVE